MIFLLAFSVTAVFAGGSDRVENLYFSIKIPDNWTYKEGSNTPQAESTGFGPANLIMLTPSEFNDILLGKAVHNGVFAYFIQDAYYPIKNAGLDLFVKYQIDKQDAINVTSKQNVTIDGEPAVKVYADGNGTKFVEYMAWHNKQPYDIGYMANVKDYDKYLPQFEQIVKTFKFIDEK
jgi:hypothetical protein